MEIVGLAGDDGRAEGKEGEEEGNISHITLGHLLWGSSSFDAVL